MENKKLTQEVRAMILDIIDNVSRNTNISVDKLCSYWSQGLSREADYFIALVEDKFTKLSWSRPKVLIHESCVDVPGALVNIFIRQILFEKYIIYSRGGVPPTDNKKQ